MRVGPVAFLFLAVGGWAAVRGVMLWPDGPEPRRPKRIAWQPALPRAPSDPPAPTPSATRPERSASFHRAPRPALAVRVPVESIEAGLAFPALAEGVRPAASPPPAPTAVHPAHPPQPPSPASRDGGALRLSAWAVLRGRAEPGLASAGQLSGSQAGLRAAYELGSGLAVAARVSGPLRSLRGKEAALALDWRPSRRIPVTFTIERRAGLDKAGRDAFAAGVYGGWDSLALPGGVRLDGYAQAGLVGLKRRDAYVDGALRAERPLLSAGRFRLGAGAGLWGGAQPGVSRLDVGPQIVAHAPVAGGAVRIGAEWRQRVAGKARPGSGAVLSLGADF